jgi:hypothetical protein
MITVPTECHTQNNKDHGRRPVTRRLKRAREKKRETDSDSEKNSEGRNLKRRGPGGHESYGPRGSPTDSVGSREGRRAAAGRDEGGASLKETRSIGPSPASAKDTSSDRHGDRFMNSNQDLMYRLTRTPSRTRTIKSIPTGKARLDSESGFMMPIQEKSKG